MHEESNDGEHGKKKCKVVGILLRQSLQDRYKVNEIITGINTPCDVSAIGGNSAYYDYVEFYMKYIYQS